MTCRNGSLARIPLGLLVVLGLAVSGCRDRGPAGETAEVRALTMGDRACYMELEDERGQVSESEASFELCERTDLIGQRVRLTRESTPIMASSCEGDPECAERDTVDLIVTAEPSP